MMAGKKGWKDEDEDERTSTIGYGREKAVFDGQSLASDRRFPLRKTDTREPNVLRLPNTIRRNKYRRTTILSLWPVCPEIAREGPAELSAAI
jgi:hypothetical protein